jgi:hypothetical protein
VKHQNADARWWCKPLEHIRSALEVFRVNAPAAKLSKVVQEWSQFHYEGMYEHGRQLFQVTCRSLSGW